MLLYFCPNSLYMSTPRRAPFTLKKLFGQIHLWLGLASGLVVLVVALTGSIMVFQEELEPVLFRKEMIVQVQSHRLPVDSLIAVAAAQYPKIPVRQVRVFAKENRSVLVLAGKVKRDTWKYLYIDPYTGKVLGKGKSESRFFEVVLSLHRYLLAGDTGKIITGISCSMFFILTISGIIIWWPANKAAMKQRFRVKWDASFKRVNWDWHAVIGFYSSFFLLAISLTGLVWSYQWMENLLYTVTGSKQEKEVKVMSKDLTVTKDAGVYEKVLVATNQAYPYHGRVIINLPASDSLSVLVVKSNEDALVTNQSSMVWFDAHTGSQLKIKPFEKLNLGDKARRMIYPIHTGSFFGWPTKIMALFISLFAATLPVSGFLIWLGRKKKAKKPGKAQTGQKKAQIAVLATD